jgi:hypothetical protein
MEKLYRVKYPVKTKEMKRVVFIFTILRKMQTELGTLKEMHFRQFRVHIKMDLLGQLT